MTPLTIRPAVPGDLDALAGIYRAARAFMAASGNPHQWGASHPPLSQLAGDIARGQLYVLCDGARPCAAFALTPGPDPAYAHIEGGAWRSDAPYAVVHRLASDGSRRGVFAAALAFCAAQCPHLRIDTHADNRVMQHLVARAGFQYCGVIYVRDAGAPSPRLAYERLPGEGVQQK